jgi:hypothetical protein
MSVSPHTLRLNSLAHSLGDKYYRELTTAGSHGSQSNELLKDLALSYLDALENLLGHLGKAKGADADAILMKRTQKYIELVRRDLQRYGKQTKPPHAMGYTGWNPPYN